MKIVSPGHQGAGENDGIDGGQAERTGEIGGGECVSQSYIA